MAAFNKVNAFVEQIAEGVHDLGSDTLKLALTNTLPTAANVVFADITEIAPGNGYTAGGVAVTITSSSQTGGVYRLVGDDVVFSATGGSIGPFRYVVLYNDTPVSPAKPLIGWYDYGSSITLNNGESMTADFDQVGGLITLT